MITHNQNNLELIDYRELTPLQGDLKDLNQKNYKKLLNSIKKYGFKYPVFVWKNGNKNYILDGTQRHRVLSQEAIKFDNTEYKIPALIVEAENERDAATQILHITSGYGKTTQEGYEEFVERFEISEIEIEDIEIRDVFIGEQRIQENKEIDVDNIFENEKTITCPKCKFEFNV